MLPVKQTIGLTFMALFSAVMLLSSMSSYAAGKGVANNSRQPVEHVVYIEAMQFSPATLHVIAGDTITWINRDFVPHTATAMDKRWDTGALAKGEQSSMVIGEDTAGQYFCRFHPGMTALLELKSK